MEFYQWKFQTLYALVEKRLSAVGYGVHQARDLQHARELVLDMIPAGQRVAFHPSRILSVAGIPEALCDGEYHLITPLTAAGAEATLAAQRAALDADTYVGNVDAITRNGRLMLFDEIGGRSSAVLFGPRRVILMASMERVVPDIETAIKRYHSPIPGIEPEESMPAENVPTDEMLGDCRSATLLRNCRADAGRMQIILLMQRIESMAEEA